MIDPNWCRENPEEAAALIAEVEKERDDTHAALVRRHADLHAAQKERDAARAELRQAEIVAERNLQDWQRAEKERDAARAALREILDPLGTMAERARAEGRQLSGMAYSIANSVPHLQSIARTALSDHQTEGADPLDTRQMNEREEWLRGE